MYKEIKTQEEAFQVLDRHYTILRYGAERSSKTSLYYFQIRRAGKDCYRYYDGLSATHTDHARESISNVLTSETWYWWKPDNYRE